MAENYTEEEDKLISWFKENYVNMIIGVVIGTALVLGYNYQQDNALNNQYEISLKYERALASYHEKQYSYILTLSEELSKTDPENIYASLSNLYSAKIYHDKKQYDKALNSLDHIIQNAKSDEILTIAKLRSARILIYLKRYDEAKGIILSIENYNTQVIPTELLGDVEYYNNNLKEAKKFYQLSLKNEMTPNKRKIIENKINSIN
jgi:predicted negative regulator of RcsB-dependent stress response